MSETPSCGVCRFHGVASPHHNNRPGTMPGGLACFRFPPVFHHYRASEFEYETGFGPPRVSFDGWCGEYRPMIADRTPTTQGGRSTMSEKPVKLTPAMEGVLRSAFNFGTPITKDRMEIMGHRLGTYEALYNRGLMSRPALSHSPYTLTDAGRAHPAATQGDAP